MIKDYKGKAMRIHKGKISHASTHPEIGELREKFMYKDLKVFKKYKISNFIRPPYEGELDSYEKEVITDACKGEECFAMNCFRISSDTRAMIPMNFEMFEKSALEENTPIYYQKQLLINSKAFKNSIKKGFQK